MEHRKETSIALPLFFTKYYSEFNLSALKSLIHEVRIIGHYLKKKNETNIHTVTSYEASIQTECVVVVVFCSLCVQSGYGYPQYYSIYALTAWLDILDLFAPKSKQVLDS